MHIGNKLLLRIKHVTEDLKFLPINYVDVTVFGISPLRKFIKISGDWTNNIPIWLSFSESKIINTPLTDIEIIECAQ